MSKIIDMLLIVVILLTRSEFKEEMLVDKI
jgi:hypothetical protein